MIAGFAATVIAGMALLIVGSFLDTTWRTVLWAAAVAIDYAGPAWLTRERLRAATVRGQSGGRARDRHRRGVTPS